MEGNDYGYFVWPPIDGVINAEYDDGHDGDIGGRAEAQRLHSALQEVDPGCWVAWECEDVVDRGTTKPKT